MSMDGCSRCGASTRLVEKGATLAAHRGKSVKSKPRSNLADSLESFTPAARQPGCELNRWLAS